MDKYTLDNIKEAMGTTFKYFDDDANSHTGGEYLDCLVPQVALNVGYTIKDINEQDPERYVWCHDMRSTKNPEGLAAENQYMVDDLNILADIIRVRGIVAWSVFARSCGIRWASPGSGSCAFA